MGAVPPPPPLSPPPEIDEAVEFHRITGLALFLPWLNAMVRLGERAWDYLEPVRGAQWSRPRPTRVAGVPKKKRGLPAPLRALSFHAPEAAEPRLNLKVHARARERERGFVAGAHRVSGPGALCGVRVLIFVFA